MISKVFNSISRSFNVTGTKHNDLENASQRTWRSTVLAYVVKGNGTNIMLSSDCTARLGGVERPCNICLWIKYISYGQASPGYRNTNVHALISYSSEKSIYTKQKYPLQRGQYTCIFWCTCIVAFENTSQKDITVTVFV